MLGRHRQSKRKSLSRGALNPGRKDRGWKTLSQALLHQVKKPHHLGSCKYHPVLFWLAVVLPWDRNNARKVFYSNAQPSSWKQWGLDEGCGNLLCRVGNGLEPLDIYMPEPEVEFDYRALQNTNTERCLRIMSLYKPQETRRVKPPLGYTGLVWGSF